MEQLTREIYSAYSEDILSFFIIKFQLGNYRLTPAESFQSVIYLCRSDKQPDFYLRITHSLHRSYSEIEAELDWIDYISNVGEINVCNSVLSRDGRRLEPYSIEHKGFKTFFFAVLFEAVRGSHPATQLFSPAFESQENDKCAYDYGIVMGTLHRSSVEEITNIRLLARPVWYEEDNYAIFKFNHLIEPKIFDKALRLIDQAKSITSAPDQFGLIHGDIHNGNVLIHDNKIHLIDFDGANFGWFVHDLAISFFNLIDLGLSGTSRYPLSSRALDSFWHGYLKHNRIKSEMLSLIPLFFRLEEIGEYILIHRSLDLDKLPHARAMFMRGRTKKIIEDTSFSDSIFEIIVESYNRNCV